MTVLKPWQIVLAGAFLVVAVTSCTSQSPGEAMPAPGGASTTTQSDPTTSATAPSTAVTLADMNACDLLTPADLAALGAAEAGEERKVGTARVCTVDTDDGGTGPAIRTNVGLDGVIGSDAKDITVGTHQAKIASDPATGGCGVFLGVSKSARVDVIAIDLRGDKEKACDLAMKAAELVEKNLPES